MISPQSSQEHSALGMSRLVVGWVQVGCTQSRKTLGCQKGAPWQQVLSQLCGKSCVPSAQQQSHCPSTQPALCCLPVKFNRAFAASQAASSEAGCHTETEVPSLSEALRPPVPAGAAGLVGLPHGHLALLAAGVKFQVLGREAGRPLRLLMQVMPLQPSCCCLGQTPHTHMMLPMFWGSREQALWGCPACGASRPRVVGRQGARQG